MTEAYQRTDARRPWLGWGLVVLCITSSCGLADRQMIEAARIGDLDQVQLYLQRGANLDARIDVFGGYFSGASPKMSALHVAVFKGHTDVVRFLVENGADIHLPTKSFSGSSDRSALKMACDLGNFEIAMILFREEMFEAVTATSAVEACRSLATSGELES